MHHLVKKVTIVSALAMSCAHASDAITTKVISVDGGLVTLAVDGTYPAWLQKGNMIQTGSWQARVHATDNGTVTISLPKTNAAKLGINSDVTVKAFAREESFGC
jgi:sRNA-binding carbon storage regulator CsrA